MSKPDVDVCIVNAPFKQRKCYNLKDDYDNDGNLKATATAVIRPNESIEDLNKAMVIDSPYDLENPNDHHFEDGIARLKRYIKELKEASKCK